MFDFLKQLAIPGPAFYLECKMAQWEIENEREKARRKKRHRNFLLSRRASINQF